MSKPSEAPKPVVEFLEPIRPLTVRGLAGLTVPIPVLPELSTTTRGLPLPSDRTMWLLEVRMSKPCWLPVYDPRTTFLEPVVTAWPALKPTNVFLEPVVALEPAAKPTLVFWPPVVIASPVSEPINVLSSPVVTFLPA